MVLRKDLNSHLESSMQDHLMKMMTSHMELKREHRELEADHSKLEAEHSYTLKRTNACECMGEVCGSSHRR